MFKNIFAPTRRDEPRPGSLAHVEATAMAIEMVASQAKASMANKLSSNFIGPLPA
jgi:hypothetical protein